MTAIIFDGRAFAKEKEEELKKKVSKLDFKPKLVSILVGKDPASVLYTKLKQKAAKHIGMQFTIYNFQNSVNPEKIVKLIKKLNKDKNMNGIMVQLPLPLKIENWKLKIIGAIARDKDVDGLTKNSLYIPATTKAIIRILGEAKKKVKLGNENVVVIGSKGMVGKSVVKELKNLGFSVKGIDKYTKYNIQHTIDADILISATGKPNLITGNMVKEGAVIIDVGSPKGDVDESVKQKAGFLTPVPGGVGPVTIISLLENLLQSVSIELLR